MIRAPSVGKIWARSAWRRKIPAQATLRPGQQALSPIRQRGAAGHAVALRFARLNPSCLNRENKCSGPIRRFYLSQTPSGALEQKHMREPFPLQRSAKFPEQTLAHADIRLRHH